MTNIQTKKELNDEYQNVKYILTSGMRTKLLLSLYEHSKKLEEIRNDLKKPSATILHGLKELENKNLIRKIQKNYELTSNGYILTTNMIKLIENWNSINKNKQFWNNHDLSDIPEEMLKDIYLLKNAYDPNLTEKDETLDLHLCMEMKADGRLLRTDKHVHSYPHCWRTDKPVIYYPLDSWFIQSTKAR